MLGENERQAEGKGESERKEWRAESTGAGKREK